MEKLAIDFINNIRLETYCQSYVIWLFFVFFKEDNYTVKLFVLFTVNIFKIFHKCFTGET